MFAASSSGSSSILILYVVLFGALYFFYLRPRSKKQKAARLEARQVEVGERAQTVGGFVGTVVSKNDQLVTLRATSGAELDFVTSAIAKRFESAVPESRDDAPTGDAGTSEEGDDK